MGKKKEKPINLNELEEEEKMKYERSEEHTSELQSP